MTVTSRTQRLMASFIIGASALGLSACGGSDDSSSKSTVTKTVEASMSDGASDGQVGDGASATSSQSGFGAEGPTDVAVSGNITDFTKPDPTLAAPAERCQSILGTPVEFAKKMKLPDGTTTKADWVETSDGDDSGISGRFYKNAIGANLVLCDFDNMKAGLQVTVQDGSTITQPPSGEQGEALCRIGSRTGSQVSIEATSDEHPATAETKTAAQAVCSEIAQKFNIQG